MDLEPVFTSLANLIRSIPRSELLVMTLVAMVVGWIGAVMVRRRMKLGTALRTFSTVILATILVTVVLQLSRFDSRLDIAVPQLGLPEQVVEGGETRIALAPDGHYWLRAEVNGVPANFLVDTGATLTALSAPVARAAGVEPRTGAVPVMLSTANGTVAAELATIESIEFGNIRASGIDAVTTESLGDTNVIGMNVLSRLASWRVEEGVLILTPAQADIAPDQESVAS